MSWKGKDGKTILLVGLLLIWGLLLWWRLADKPLRDTGGASTPSSRRAEPARGVLPLLKLDLPRPERPRFETNFRNIFTALRKESKPKVPKVQVPATPPPPPPEPPPPAPDPFLEGIKTLQYLGFAEAQGEKTAFLAEGSEVLLAREAETIGERYRVKTITPEYVTLTTPDGTKEARVSLTTETPSPRHRRRR
ncbi:MAG: hypothetical protein ACE5HK_02835 [Candidatus Methylomirabilales bacterium]